MNNTCVITIIVYMRIINDQQKDAKDAPIIWTLLASLLLVGQGSSLGQGKAWQPGNNSSINHQEQLSE